MSISRSELALAILLAYGTDRAGAQIGPPPGGGSGGGGVTSLTTSCPAGLSGATGAVTAVGAAPVVVQSAASVTLTAVACGQVEQFTYAATPSQAVQTASLPSGQSAGWFTNVVITGTGVVLTPISGTINGAASLVLAQGQSAGITFDGANWEALVGQTIASGPTPIGGSFLYYKLQPVTNAAASNFNLNFIYCESFYINRPVHIDQMGFLVQTTGASGQFTGIGIYNVSFDGTTHKLQMEGAPIYSDTTGIQGNTVTGGNPMTWTLGSGTGLFFNVGMYAVCENSTDATLKAYMLNSSAWNAYVYGVDSISDATTPAGNGGPIVGWRFSQTYGTWPTFATGTSFSGVGPLNVPDFVYRVYSYP